jgi:hypothetical protein
MGPIGLAEAARLTGKNQSTIHRAMKAGRLSYSKDEAGERKVDLAELERVFGINGARPGMDAPTLACNDMQGMVASSLAALQARLEERDRMIAAHEATIADLRARLDSEAEERRRLLALLTDRRPWWRRWLR